MPTNARSRKLDKLRTGAATTSTPIPSAIPTAVVDTEPEPEPELIPEPEPESTPEPEPVVSDPGKLAISALDLADQITSSPQMKAVATAEAERLLSQMLFDATSDNRVVVTLSGQAMKQYKSDWIIFNAHRLNKIPFSSYLATRLELCSQHSSDKSIYLRAEHIQQLDKLADDNFQSADRLVAWISRVITPVSKVEGQVEPIHLDVIPSQIWDRYVGRCYADETPAKLIGEAFIKFLQKELGLI